MEIESIVANSALIRAREGKHFLYGIICLINMFRDISKDQRSLKRVGN